MSKPTPDPKKRYESLMRNAGERKRSISVRTLENEQRFRRAQERLEQERTPTEQSGRVEKDLRQHAENLHIAGLIARELAVLKLKLATAADSEERILLKAEIAHLSALKSNLKHQPSRKPPRRPPESGIAVPAVPPTGPLPKRGGAEATLDFGA